MEENGIDAIKKTLIHLLFGKGRYTQRITACIFDPNYKLRHFGESCIQETYGWDLGTTDTQDLRRVLALLIRRSSPRFVVLRLTFVLIS
jgi:hypothetical protein